MSALTFANLLHDIFDVDVPVGVIVSPASDLAAIAAYVEVHASDLTLDKFLNEATLAAAPSLSRPSTEVRTVLLTGATGFLGRYTKP
jgi:fatty acid CoA ligase FadD9